jgi:rRNA maturation endonuclease Nob1
MEPQRLFQEVRDRLICLEHFKETRPEKLAATDIAKLLKAVDLMNDTLRYYALVQDDLAAENTLEAIRLLSEAKAEEEGE